jgi:hypothetical protein
LLLKKHTAKLSWIEERKSEGNFNNSDFFTAKFDICSNANISQATATIPNQYHASREVAAGFKVYGDGIAEAS